MVKFASLFGELLLLVLISAVDYLVSGLSSNQVHDRSHSQDVGVSRFLPVVRQIPSDVVNR